MGIPHGLTFATHRLLRRSLQVHILRGERHSNPGQAMPIAKSAWTICCVKYGIGNRLGGRSVFMLAIPRRSWSPRSG
jgi:hypothetical protein